jgi:8-oxo-dGTP pyrophosphatase MutT (NUDIX family)
VLTGFSNYGDLPYSWIADAARKLAANPDVKAVALVIDSPGGTCSGIDEAATALEALARELREEGHIELTGAPVLHGVYLNTFVTRRDHVLIYVVRDFQQTHARGADLEIVESGFFPVDNLPEETARGSRARLKEVLDGAPASALW